MNGTNPVKIILRRPLIALTLSRPHLLVGLIALSPKQSHWSNPELESQDLHGFSRQDFISNPAKKSQHSDYP